MNTQYGYEINLLIGNEKQNIFIECDSKEELDDLHNRLSNELERTDIDQINITTDSKLIKINLDNISFITSEKIIINNELNDFNIEEDFIDIDETNVKEFYDNDFIIESINNKSEKEPVKRKSRTKKEDKQPLKKLKQKEEPELKEKEEIKEKENNEIDLTIDEE